MVMLSITVCGCVMLIFFQYVVICYVNILLVRGYILCQCPFSIWLSYHLVILLKHSRTSYHMVKGLLLLTLLLCFFIITIVYDHIVVLLCYCVALWLSGCIRIILYGKQLVGAILAGNIFILISIPACGFADI